MHPEVRRTLVALSASYALMWATVSMVAGPGSAALVSLTGHLSLAGVFIALFGLSAAAGAALFGRVMDRFGRRPGLMVGHVIAAAGYATAGAAQAWSLTMPFLVGTFLLAFGFGGVNLSRVAAAEIFPPAGRGRAVAWLQVSATLGAVVGPLLLILSEPIGHFAGRSPLTLVWFFAPPLLVVAALVVARAAEPLRIAADLARYHPELAGAAVAGPVPAAPGVVPAAVVALVASQASMASVMGVAGAAVGYAGHGVVVLGVLMLLHFVGMFGLSRVVGRAADALGRRATILIGLGTLAVGGVVVASFDNMVGFGAGLLVVGLGWSFGFIGASVLLTDVTVPARRARVLGRADFAAQASTAVVAAAGGWWFASRGIVGLGILTVAVVALPLVMLVFVREARPVPAP